MVKSRHKILMPMLVIGLTQGKQKTSGGYKSSFARNIHERTDNPVFTVEDAIDQLRAENCLLNSNKKKSFYEQEMDNFFLTHLPEKILNLSGKNAKDFE